ncbi:ATP-binding protein [Ruegeria sp. WL0004]|uniref:histidine kinase n=1 Tax=Ruegeria marisflavi TaxID=2984152 RepID=A0ABT2X2C3_9RHOB|nr:ATP-binding protein [Ruegeria sp. WL0004]MCU9840238.1 ATP-binding protein [Ruegeria sp. WL0004]
MRLVPQSLRLQIVCLVLAALAVAQGVTLVLLEDQRNLAVRAAIGDEATGRAANVVRLIEKAPANLHEQIVRAANSPLVRFEIGADPVVDHVSHDARGTTEARIRALLDDDFSREIRAEMHEIDSSALPLPYLEPGMAEQHRELMRGQMLTVELELSIALAGGDWLNVSTRFERPPFQWPRFATLSFGLSAGFILLALFWYFLARVTEPLRLLAEAAEKLGPEQGGPVLINSGPCEVRELVQAFNRMQDRIFRLVAERTHILAAMGHDLRSPLTAMRVRSELVEDDETRESLIASVEEMQHMVEEALSFARGLADAEPEQRCDLGAFLETLRQDMPNGYVLNHGSSVKVSLRPNAMRRALRNVIENAQRYGTEAEVTYANEGGTAVIRICDRGPGIAEPELERVFDPFVRLETSRARATGGYGLGLSITRGILQAHNGDIVLSNRPDGGLCATLTLPLDAAERR